MRKYTLHTLAYAMNNMMHEQLNQLRLIGILRVGNSIDTINKTIYEPTWYMWLYRKYYHDDKDCVTRFLQEFYRNLQQTSEALIRDLHAHEAAKWNIKIAITMAEELRASIRGLENLSKTYAKYPKTVTEIKGIVQDYAVVIYKRLLETIPEEDLKTKKDLLETVEYYGVPV